MGTIALTRCIYITCSQVNLIFLFLLPVCLTFLFLVFNVFLFAFAADVFLSFIHVPVLSYHTPAIISLLQTHLTKAANFFTPKRTGIFCLLFWLISFIIICPTTFGADGFGHWGYSDTQG